MAWTAETKEAADILDKIKGLKERFAKARRREDDVGCLTLRRGLG